MRKLWIAGFLLFAITTANAQIELLKIVGKNSKNYGLGFGASLKFSKPVSDAAYATIEAGVKFAYEKDDPKFGIALCPLKLGYRYTLNRTGTGLYVEPQAGYNLYGVRSYYSEATYETVDEKFHGVVGALGVGYLFQPGRTIQFDLGAYYESIIYKGKSASYVGLRLSHNFSFGRRDSY